MELETEISDGKTVVSSCGSRGVVVGREPFTQSFLIVPDGTTELWEVHRFSALSPAHLERLCLMDSDVLVIGTGVSQCLPDTALSRILADHGRSAEFMSSRSACTTFNILTLDHRRVLAAPLVRRRGGELFPHLPPPLFNSLLLYLPLPSFLLLPLH